MSSTSIIRTRIAPSPTGEYHVGHLRTCLYDYALAKKNNGQFIIRIEDTDQKRLVPGAMDRILQVIKDCGLTWDEGPDIGGPYAPYIQTQRLEIYKPYVQQLIDQGHAYYCFCDEDRLKEVRTIQKAAKKIPKYDRHCLNLSKEEITSKLEKGDSYVIRMRMPDHEIVEFDDAIRGKIRVNTDDLDDQVLIKSNGIPTYHFAVVVDDHLMNITHVFRGEEWIPSTPKQILLYRFFNWEVPVFAHLTVLMDPDGRGKMSKRHGSVSVRSFLDDGYLPQALLNFLMLLGWNPGDNREIFTLEEFVNEFSLQKLHKKSPAFDRKKLDYFNGLYIRQLSADDLRKYFIKFLPQATSSQIEVFLPILRDRIAKFSELPNLLKFIWQDVDYGRELFDSKKIDYQFAQQVLTTTLAYFQNHPPITVANIDTVKSDLMNIINTNNWKVGDYFMVLRIAICGAVFTPPVVECLPALDQESILRKLKKALSLLK